MTVTVMVCSLVYCTEPTVFGEGRGLHYGQMELPLSLNISELHSAPVGQPLTSVMAGGGEK